MKEKESVPFAPALIESMRSIGYSFNTAIADLIDNSISADAKHIDINMSFENEPSIFILDDGNGMTNIELEEAMRYGSKNPLDERDGKDLGRFGLGMKAASLSQCRKLTVISIKDNKFSAFIWDLDHIILRGKWALLEMSEYEIKNNDYFEKLNCYKSGTLLILEKFDRVKKTTGNLEKTLNEKLVATIDHLSLVFHRFIENDLSISVNNLLIQAKDPFLKNNKSTLYRRAQSFFIDEEMITAKPYILPHINKMTKEDLSMLGGKEELRRGQGFYIYRNKRLIIWGTWFNLERKHELNRLARVKVDIPNSLDYVWSIDIKKSAAILPDIIKKNLYSAVSEAVNLSEEVHTYRGRQKNSSTSISYIWQRIKTRSGYSYNINRDLPQLQILKKLINDENYAQLEKLIKLLEESIPSSTIYLDVSNNNYESDFSYETEKMFNDIKENINIAKECGIDLKSFLKTLENTEPYCKDEKVKEYIREEIVKYG